VWCTTLRGDILQWDARTHQRLLLVQLPELVQDRLTLMSIVPVGNSALWCGCGNALVVYNRVTKALDPFPDHAAGGPLSPQGGSTAPSTPPPTATPDGAQTPTPDEEFRALEESIRARSRKLADQFGEAAGFSIHSQAFTATPAEKAPALVYVGPRMTMSSLIWLIPLR